MEQLFKTTSEATERKMHNRPTIRGRKQRFRKSVGFHAQNAQDLDELLYFND